MLDLSRRIQERIDSLRSRQAEIEAEIHDLETAARVLKGFGSCADEGPVSRNEPAGNGVQPVSLAGQSARVVAAKILLGHDPERQGMHYKQIFDRATQAGWEGELQTLRRTMNKNRDGAFLSLGDGRYCLRPSEPAEEESEHAE